MRPGLILRVLTALPVSAIVASACAAPTPLGAGCENSLWWRDAREHVGAWATVRGMVVDSRFAVDGEGQPTFLDLGNAYPDPDRFTVRIWGRDRVNFAAPPEQTYRNRTICVTGVIDTSVGSPGVDVTQPSSLLML